MFDEIVVGIVLAIIIIGAIWFWWRVGKEGKDKSGWEENNGLKVDDCPILPMRVDDTVEIIKVRRK